MPAAAGRYRQRMPRAIAATPPPRRHYAIERQRHYARGHTPPLTLLGHYASSHASHYATPALRHFSRCITPEGADITLRHYAATLRRHSWPATLIRRSRPLLRQPPMARQISTYLPPEMPFASARDASQTPDLPITTPPLRHNSHCHWPDRDTYATEPAADSRHQNRQFANTPRRRGCAE